MRLTDENIQLEGDEEYRLVKDLTGISVDDFETYERMVDDKLEYENGLVYCMTGGSKNHNTISLNLAAAFRNHLPLEGRCRSFMADVKVSIRARSATADYYPDVLVGCGDNMNAYEETEPLIVAEVLSQGTASRDRNVKVGHYKLLPNLKEILLIYQDVFIVEMWHREQESWRMKIYKGEDSIQFASIGLELALADIYRGVR